MALKSHNPEVFSLFLRFSLIMIFPLLLNFMMGLVEMFAGWYSIRYFDAFSVVIETNVEQ